MKTMANVKVHLRTRRGNVNIYLYYIQSSEIQKYIDEIYCVFYIFTSENIKFYIFTPPGCKYNYSGLPLTFPLTYCSALQNFKRQ